MSGEKLPIPPGVLSAVLRHYPALGALVAIRRNGLSINAATCLFETERGWFFLKRYDPLSRDPAAAVSEHLVARHLQERGFPTPALHLNDAGETFTWHLGAAYAIYDQARGEDRYGHVAVFDPFGTPEEAHAAGATLARFHLAMQDAPALPERRGVGLIASYEWVLPPGPADRATARWQAAPRLGAFVQAQAAWPRVLTRLASWAETLAPWLPECPRGVNHGDFIKRNLFWADREVSAVIDFDLAAPGLWIHDLALALLPCGFDWPRILAGEAEPNAEALAAMLAGYQSVRPLEPGERAALPGVVETARVEFYMSAVQSALERQDQAEAERFWALLAGTSDWFSTHAAWHEGLAASCPTEPTRG